MNRRRARALLKALVRLGQARRAPMLARLPPAAIRAIAEEWWWQAHGGQAEPDGEWRTWLIMAGRGFGKTRAGAEWVWARARACPGARIALVGGYHGPGASPDRADAMVWAMTELFKPGREPRIRTL